MLGSLIMDADILNPPSVDREFKVKDTPLVALDR
jgi:hypothetical protein